MPVPSQENWNNYLLGRFVVIREEVGGDGVVLGHSRAPSKSLSKSHSRSSNGGSLSESRSGTSKRSFERGPDSEGASLSSRDKGKAKEENILDGLPSDSRACGLPQFLFLVFLGFSHARRPLSIHVIDGQ